MDAHKEDLLRRLASPDRAVAAAARAEAKAAREAANQAAIAAHLAARSPIAVAPQGRCGHDEVDNRGTCYGCGAYVRSADAGAFTY